MGASRVIAVTITTAVALLGAVGVANAQEDLSSVDWSLSVHRGVHVHRAPRIEVAITSDSNCWPNCQISQVRAWVTRRGRTLKSATFQGIPAVGFGIPSRPLSMKQRLKRGDVIHVAADGTPRFRVVFRGFLGVAPVSCGSDTVRALRRGTFVVVLFRNHPPEQPKRRGRDPRVYHYFLPIRRRNALGLQWGDTYAGYAHSRTAKVFAHDDLLGYEIRNVVNPACH